MIQFYTIFILSINEKNLFLPNYIIHYSNLSLLFLHPHT